MSRNQLLIICLVCVMCFGCAHKQKDAAADNESAYSQYQQFRERYARDGFTNGDMMDGMDEEDIAQYRDTHASSAVLNRAKSAIGTPYRFGGTQPGGFDCSGLVQWAYKGAGIKLPRTAAEQSSVGYKIRDLGEMRAGDIVAFRRSRGGYHTGIYVGNGMFVHAPRTNSRVRLESLETGYFHRNFIGARRVDARNRNEALAEAARKEDIQLAQKKAAKKNKQAASGKGKGKTSSKQAAKKPAKSAPKKTAQKAQQKTPQKQAQKSAPKKQPQKAAQKPQNKAPQKTAQKQPAQKKDSTQAKSGQKKASGQKTAEPAPAKKAAAQKAPQKQAQKSAQKTAQKPAQKAAASQKQAAQKTQAAKASASQDRKQITVLPAGKGAANIQAQASQAGGKATAKQ